jgi:hypothetical protein
MHKQSTDVSRPVDLFVPMHRAFKKHTICSGSSDDEKSFCQCGSSNNFRISCEQNVFVDNSTEVMMII